MTELLPCPFCGGNFIVACRTNDKSKYVVMCNETDCQMEVLTDQFDTRSEAVAAWNTRTPTTSAATPSGLGSMRRERYIWDSAISTAVAEVERLVDGWKNEGRFTLCWATRKDTASEIITALRALQPSTPSERESD